MRLLLAALLTTLAGAIPGTGTVYAQTPGDFSTVVQLVQSSPDPEERIRALAAALPNYSPGYSPLQWAWLQLKLGGEYIWRDAGDRADNYERAIGALSSALTIYTRDGAPNEWGAAQERLAIVYRARIAGDRADNLERAIAASEAALSVPTKDRLPAIWADTQQGLGLAYYDRIRGERSENLERAIAAFESALTVLLPAGDPADFVIASKYLASAYAARTKGVRADNIERAIAVYEAAIAVLPAEQDRRDWAAMCANVANLYTERERGDQASNLDKAIRSYEAALTVFTSAQFPHDFATAQKARGDAYLLRISGERQANLRTAIAAYGLVLPVRTSETAPVTWAQLQYNIGFAYAELSRDDPKGRREDNLDRAIEAFRAALTVRTRETEPRDWALTLTELGGAYNRRGRGARDENIAQAIESLTAALSVRTIEANPLEHVVTRGFLATAFMSKGDWPQARTALEGTLAAFRIVFGLGLDEPEARRLMATAGPLFKHAAFVAAELGDGPAALELLNEGRAKLLSADLRLETLNVAPETRQRLQKLAYEIRLEAYLIAHGEEAGRDQAREQLAVRRQELARLGKDIGAAKPAPVASKASFAQLIPPGGAIVAPIITAEFGGKMLIATRRGGVPQIDIVDMPGLSFQTAAGLMSGWIGAYRNNYKRLAAVQTSESRKLWNEWLAAVEAVGPRIWALFGGPLDQALARRGIASGARIVWMPSTLLTVLPLGLAEEPGTGRRLLDSYEIVTVPNLETLAASAKSVAEPAPRSLGAIVNPTGDNPRLDLPFTDIEGALVATHFPAESRLVLDRKWTEPMIALTGLAGATYWHFASHGRVDWADPGQSGLIMKDEKVLTADLFLIASKGFEGRLGRPRLVVLSACETGLINPVSENDEFTGLQTTFLHMGAAGVLSTAWQVDDLATALLVSKFYDLHLDAGQSPPTALKQAQAWLRDATTADLLAYAQAASARAQLSPADARRLETALTANLRPMAGLSGTLWTWMQKKLGTSPPAQAGDKAPRPFAHPYYWGAFTYSGL